MSQGKTRTFENISATPVGKKGWVNILFDKSFAGKAKVTRGGSVDFQSTYWPQQLVRESGGFILLPEGRIFSAAKAAQRKNGRKKESVMRSH